MVSGLAMSNEWSAIKSLLLSRLLSTQLMHNVSCAMFATFVSLSTIVVKKSALQISAAICWKTCSIKTFIILLWMSLEVYLSPFGFIQSFRNGLFSACKQYNCWKLKLISPALSPCNSNACHGRNQALDSVLDSTSSRLTNFSTDYSLEDVSPTFSVHVERTRVRSTASLWPFNNCDPWNLFPHKFHFSSWYILQKSIVVQYCCWRCNFGGMLVHIHGKMLYNASRCNECTDVSENNFSRKNMSLFSSFWIYGA